jgi:hypothetical protein
MRSLKGAPPLRFASLAFLIETTGLVQLHRLSPHTENLARTHTSVEHDRKNKGAGSDFLYFRLYRHGESPLGVASPLRENTTQVPFQEADFTAG